MSDTTRSRSVVIAAIGATLIASVLTGCTGTSDAAPTARPSATRTATVPPTGVAAPTVTAAPRATGTPTAGPTAAAAPPPSASVTASESTQAPSSAAAPPASRYRVDDPATWTIAGDEVGPIAIGGRTAAETDDLAAAYHLDAGECPAAPATQFWLNGRNPSLIVTDRSGTVSGVAVGDFEQGAVAARTPRTTEGAGVGTSLAELQRLYPRLSYMGTAGADRGRYSMWGISDHGGHITFELGDDGVHVGMVWVSAQPQPPYEFCN